MKKKRFTKIILILLFALGLVAVAFYKFDNPDVTVLIDTRDGDVSATYSYVELKDMNQIAFEFANFDQSNLTEVRIYHMFKTVCVDKITADEFAYNTVYENGEITFNETIRNRLIDNAESFLTERMFLAECLLALILFIYIIINAVSESKEANRKDNHGPIYEIKRFAGDIKKYWQYMTFAANADLRAEVANSYLNRLWWLLEPLFNMLVYVIVFGRVMGNSIQNYATFVFSALLMWNYFNKTINYSVKCVRTNRDIVTKVYVPKHVLLITNMILNMYKLFFSLIILVPMLLIFRVPIGINVLYIIPAYVLMITVSFAVGMILLHYGVYVDDLGYAIGILLQMLMFLSGIFYDVVSALALPLNNIMMAINPVAIFIDSMRNALLYNVISNVPFIIVWTVISLLMAYVGVHIVYKNENGYVKVV